MLQIPLQLWVRLFPMNEVAKPASYATLTTVETAASFSKIGDRR
jgi:hypothetical protein